MEMKQCAFGHFYDVAIHARCPYCGRRGDDESGPRILRREDLGASVAGGADEAVRPVTGWLVCVAGPDRGRSYELRDENNFVGHGEIMDVNLKSDAGISRDWPVVVTYDRQSQGFFCGITGGRDVVRLNGKPLLTTAELRAGDEIELSQTRLRFVPLCGPGFDWPWADLD